MELSLPPSAKQIEGYETTASRKNNFGIKNVSYRTAV
jgi:hypothetical protein